MSKHVAFESNGIQRFDFCAECGEVMYLNRLTNNWAHAVKAGLLHDHPATRMVYTSSATELRRYG